jgi:hypothetical protein
MIFPFLCGASSMSRLIGEPVKVHGKEESAIDVFIWRKRLYRVEEVIGWWWEPGEWWDGKAARFFVRAIATNSSTGTYELYRLGKEWFLHRVLD